MATITKVGSPSLTSVLPPQNTTIVGLYAGEDIAAGDVCYINADATIMRSSGVQVDPLNPTDSELAAARAYGIALTSAAAGEAITISRNINLRYGTGLTPGARLYVGEDPGSLDDGPTDGGTEPVAFVLHDGRRIHFHGSAY